MKFTSAGERGGTPLVQHDCPRYTAVYVSAEPSREGEEYVVPGCGCRPGKESNGEDVSG